jgi:hypothetical protein
MKYFLISWYNQTGNRIGALNAYTANDKAELYWEYRRAYGSEAKCEIIELTCKAEISEYEWKEL